MGFPRFSHAFFSPWCTTLCSVIISGFKHVQKIWDQNETLGNVELLKFGSGQKGFWGTLIKLYSSPTCATWTRWIIRASEHVYKFWDHLDMFGSAKLFKLGKGQKWFWGGLMMFCWSSRHEAFQDHQICHIWHARIFLELMQKISLKNICWRKFPL